MFYRVYGIWYIYDICVVKDIKLSYIRKLEKIEGMK